MNNSLSLARDFLEKEPVSLLVALLALSLIFSTGSLYSDQQEPFWAAFVISMVTLGVGFLGHELAHKYVAIRYGGRARFRLWWYGLLLSIAISIIPPGVFKMAAPGAVQIEAAYAGSQGQERQIVGVIALVGPLTNVLAALVFLGFSFSSGTIGDLGLTGLRINVVLAAFNLLPFLVLDGQKILSWDRTVWAVITIPVWAATIATSVQFAIR